MKLYSESISKQYGTNKALKEFSYEFTPGAYGLLGPNGAGKVNLEDVMDRKLSAFSGGMKKIWDFLKMN